MTPSWYPAKREHGKTVPTWNYVVGAGQGVRGGGRAWLMRHLNELGSERGAVTRTVEVSDADSYVDSMLKGIKAALK